MLDRSFGMGLILTAFLSCSSFAEDFPPLPEPNPYTAPPVASQTGTWTFGVGASPQVTANFGSIDPRAGRIFQMGISGSTDYSNADITVTNTLVGNQTGINAIAHDTITVSGAGLFAGNVNQTTASCLSAPCVAQQHFGGNLGFNHGTGQGSTVLPYTSHSAAEFVAANQPAYGPQTVTLSSSTATTDVNGSFTKYSVTGNYSVGLGRPLAPWTSDDVMHGQLNVPQKPSAGGITVDPTPALGFTAREAANLSGYNNFNYLQTFTSSGTYVPGKGTRLTENFSGNLFPDVTSKIGDFDPLIGGNNSKQPSDQFAPYWDQVKVPGAVLPIGATNPVEVLNFNYGLKFVDGPDLYIAGRFVTFRTQLVGVSQTDVNTLTYSPLTYGDGTVDPTLVFNWVWYQEKNHCDTEVTGCVNVTGKGMPNSNDPLGMAFFLGYGDMTNEQIQAAVALQFADLPLYDSLFASAVPEVSTWAMMLLGFAGIGFIALRTGGRSIEAASSHR
jgi:hypothetical protein